MNAIAIIVLTFILLSIVGAAKTATCKVSNEKVCNIAGTIAGVITCILCIGSSIILGMSK